MYLTGVPLRVHTLYTPLGTVPRVIAATVYPLFDVAKCHIGSPSGRIRWFQDRLYSAFSDVRDLSVSLLSRPNDLCMPGKTLILAQKLEIPF